MKKSEFKAVEMVRHIRDEHHKLLKKKTNDQIKTFYRQKSEMLDVKLRELLSKTKIEREIEPTR